MLEFTDETLKTNENLKSFENTDQLGKGFVETSDKLRTLQEEYEKTKGSSLKPIDDKSTPQEIESYRKAMGVPETSDGYKFEKPKEIPEGLDYKEEVVKWWSNLAHKHHLPVNTAKAIFNEYNQFAISHYMNEGRSLEEKIEADNKKANDELLNKWGSDYTKNKELAIRCLTHFGGEKFGKKVIDYGLGNDPDVLEFMVKVASAFKDDTLKDLTMTKPKEGELKPGTLQFTYPTME